MIREYRRISQEIVEAVGFDPSVPTLVGDFFNLLVRHEILFTFVPTSPEGPCVIVGNKHLYIYADDILVVGNDHVPHKYAQWDFGNNFQPESVKEG